MVKILLAAATALGAASVGGVFFAFSWLIMPALGRIPADTAILAMQEINRVAVRSTLMPAMFGTGALAVTTAGLLWWRGDRLVSSVAFAGAALYLLGSIGITAFANVPLNDALARAHAAPAARQEWLAYADPWTSWNTIRAFFSASAAAAFAAVAAMLWASA